MKFHPDQAFHIYNQGNNREQLFYSEENYKFFLWKMKGHLLPFGDMIAWCLMPNHFHWLFLVKKVAVNNGTYREYLDSIERERRINKYGSSAQIVRREWTRKASRTKDITLNAAIGDLQKGYTRAMNKQRRRTGSLFRKGCKAKNGWIDEFTTVDTSENLGSFGIGRSYERTCFDYIHRNPVAANLVSKASQYRWSSASAYAGLTDDFICDVSVGRAFLGLGD